MSHTPHNQLGAEQRVYEQRSLEVAEELSRYSDWVTDAIRPHLAGRVLEVGAGLGAISSRYVDDVDRVVLLEPAENLHARLAHRMAGRAKVATACAFLEEVAGREVGGVSFADGSFDAVVMVNVLEHIADDVGTAALVDRLLRPGGTFVVFVPALPFIYGRLDDRVGHVRRYDRVTLRRAMSTGSLHLERMRWFDLIGIAPWFLQGRVLRQATVGDGSARRYDQLVVPVCRVADRVTGPFIGKNLLAVSRKR